MHFDDRLATVLRQTAKGETIARIQYRQLIDILGSEPVGAGDAASDAAWLRLDELSRRLPEGSRAAMLREPGLRLRNPRLVARLAEGEVPVAAAALDSAQLGEEEWLDLVPALPITARGHLARRHGAEGPVAALLDRLGIRDRGLPAPDVLDLAEIADATGGPDTRDERPSSPAPSLRAPGRPLPAPSPGSTPSPANDLADHSGGALEGGGGAIRAIVRRIEEYRKSRHAGLPGETDDAPRLPLEEFAASQRTRLRAFDFLSTSSGRICWADGEVAPLVVGLDLSGLARGQAASDALRRRQRLAGLVVELPGPDAVAGRWRLDAAPDFDGADGAFRGYLGRMRRLPASSGDSGAGASGVPDGADAMRQALHELRNPVASIQGFAEMTQQGLQGPIGHEYRALAATIASDAARILAAFDELERLVKLDAGALGVEAGETDLRAVVAGVIAQLEAFTAARESGFDLLCEDDGLRVTLGPRDAERLVWRLLASLAGAATPGEVLRLRLRHDGDRVRLVMRLPVRLALLDDEALLRAGPSPHQTVSAGMFGTGFALRLAASEARASGGSLIRKGDRLRLALPGLTADARGHSHRADAGR